MSDWMEDAVREEWDDDKLGYFVTQVEITAEISKSETLPWEVLAGLFRDKWSQLSEGIADNSPLLLPDEMDEWDNWEGSSIPWKGMEDLRDAYNLMDEEKLIGALISFETDAQTLLSIEMTRILDQKIQRGLFQGKEPYDGWPYVQGHEYEESGLDTVGFQDFKTFLVQVHRAQERYKELEQGLTDNTKGCRERRAFYRQCERWYEFLDLQDDEEKRPETLHLTVVGHPDPAESACAGQEVESGAQQTADYIGLRLGLKLSEDDKRIDGDLLRIPTGVAGRRKEHGVWWEWPSEEGELAVSLEEIRLESRVEEPKKILGRSSPLAFCAYLHRYGAADEVDAKRWCVMHAFERDRPSSARVGTGDAARARKELVGETLLFELERPLPGPIARLKAPKRKR